MDRVRFAITDHLFFKSFKKEHVDELVDCANEVRFKKGEFIFKEGDEAKEFFLISRGSVDLELFSPERGLSQIENIGEREVLGWSWLYSPYKWRFDAKAAENIEAIIFNGKKLREKCEKNHELGYRVYKLFSQIIVERLQAARMEILELYSQK